MLTLRQCRPYVTRKPPGEPTSAERSHESSLHTFLLGSAQLEGETGVLGACSPTASVNVPVGRPRKVEVDDVIDVGDIETARRNVRRDEDTVGRCLEPEMHTNLST